MAKPIVQFEVGGMRYASLGSGSGGNSTILEYEDTRVLVDAGLSAKQLKLRLDSLGISPESLTAILLTHEHSDHTRGLKVFLKKLEIPIYSTVATAQVLQDSLIGVHWKLFESGANFSLGALKVQSFHVPHDASDPVGFVFHSPQHSLGFLTDVGHITDQIRHHLQDVHSIFCEANYDSELLENDTKRPWSIKQRIASQHGHLSNIQAAELIAELTQRNLRQVLLGHLSSDCNTPEVAGEVIRSAIAEQGAAQIDLCCATQNSPTRWYKLHHTKPEPPDFTDDLFAMAERNNFR